MAAANRVAGRRVTGLRVKRRTSMTTPSRRWISVPPLIVGALIGILIGNSIHYQSSVGGLGAVLGSAFAVVQIAGSVGICALIAVIAAVVHRTGVAVVFGALAGGLVIGGVLGGLTGSSYRPPIVTDATVKIMFTAPTAVQWSDTATCTSIENGSAIASVSSERVTTLGGQAVWLRLDLGNGPAPAGLTIGQPLDEERTPPFAYREYGAAGPSLGTAELGADGRSGTVRFTDLALVTGPPLPLDPPASHLAGRVEWTCRQ